MKPGSWKGLVIQYTRTMNGYSDLVSTILKNTSLANVADVMIGENTLNLVTTDWKTRLEKDLTYQEYVDSAIHVWNPTYSTIHYNYEKSILDFDVLLVGNCRFPKPFGASKPSIAISGSEPLVKIAQAMTSDLSPGVQLSDEFKFSFRPCSVLMCKVCGQSSAAFAKKGYRLTKLHQPCIMDTKIFDGKEIVNRFQSHMEGMFPDSFLAMIRLKINVRYNYVGHNVNPNEQVYYRIGGNILDIVAFHEAKLRSVKGTINLGDLAPIQKSLELKEDTLSEEDLLLGVKRKGENSSDPLPKTPKFDEDDFLLA